MKSLLRAIGILLKFCLAMIFTGGPFILLVIVFDVSIVLSVHSS